MTLLQLRYIVALDKYRHFRLAAEACHVAQPSLSAQVQKLEENLGVILFDRSLRPIEPTEIGREVLEHARLVLAEVERLESLVQERTGEMSGELRVGILSTLAPYLLPAVMTSFSERYPDVALDVQEMRSDEIIDAIRRDILDVGLIASNVSATDLNEVPLFEESLVGYVSRGHPLYERREIRVQDLDPDSVWVMRRGHCYRDLVMNLFPEPEPDRSHSGGIKFESGNLETLQRLVDRGHGMTLLPWLAVSGERSFAPESVRPFKGKAPSRVIRLVHSRVLVKKQLVRALINEVAGAVRADLPDGSVLV